MANTRGALYVAYGEAARAETARALPTLARWHPDLCTYVIGDQPFPGERWMPFRESERGEPGRWAKVNLFKLSPFNQTLYLDADTRVYGDLSAGFRALSAGWELVIVASKPQGEQGLAHLGEIERAVTLVELPAQPLQLNSGVMFWRKCERMRQFWSVWRDEWERWRGKDQGALLRALNRVPVRALLLGQAWNGGSVVGHLFGQARG